MARTFYDSLGINEDIQLDLSMLEATGLILHDESKNHIIATQHKAAGTIVWDAIATGHHGLFLNNQYVGGACVAKQYLNAPAADTAALDFMGDYSLACWINWADTGHSEIIMGKYAVDVCGWEAYLYYTGAFTNHDYLTVRHHHSLGAALRTASYSDGWARDGNMHLFGYSRVGATAQHYRDGEPVATIVSIGGLIDPESSAARDLVIGTRFTKDTDWLYGHFHRPRAWSRALSAAEHLQMYESEKGWFP